MCTRTTKAGSPCRASAVTWFRSEMPDPRSCRSHLTTEERAEFNEIMARRRAAWEPHLQRETEFLASNPACWSWPLPTEEERAAIRAKWSKYPIEPEDLDSLVMHEWHQGRCAICGSTREELFKDHDHKTGLERGSLCRNCNTQEGQNKLPNTVFERYRQRNPANILSISVRYWDPHTGEYDQPQADLAAEDRWATAIRLL